VTEEESVIVGRIQMKLLGLKINAKFTRIETGPVVTTYYYTIGFDIPINKIIGKEEDIAISCGVESVLITRKGGEIAIAVPRADRQVVPFDSSLFHLMTAPRFASMKLPVLLGVDTLGNTAGIDLVEQPHILIAGSTGGGKSVLLASIIGGLVCSTPPEQLRLILVDTKKLDLPLFAGLPHVTDNIETVEQFHDGFNRIMGLVRKRTEKMKGLARNVTEWNKQGLGPAMPYYVIVIDELADLIDEDKAIALAKTEPYSNYPRITARIKSLVQICRAAGVHIICATQRSSVKVISGDIKANMPTRIALRLPSRADSTTILNSSGAEHLLGKGDMLLESANTSAPVRYHGSYVSNHDIAHILDNCKQIREELKKLCVTGTPA
jgi:S-DNA-T family DNA segregation ATPase FtsK/SpoIIIE